MLSLKNKIYLLASLFYVLCCFSLFFNLNFDFIIYAEISFFIVLLKFKLYRDSTKVIFWVFFILSKLLFIFLAHYMETVLPTVLKLFGYIMLCVCGFSKLRHLNISRFEFLIYGLLIILNTYVVKAIIVLIEPYIVAQYMEELYFLLGLTLIVLGAFAVRYRLINDTRSKYFAFLVLFLTLSEIVNVISYYLSISSLRYFYYFFLLFGLTNSVLFSIVENKNDRAFKLIKARVI